VQHISAVDPEIGEDVWVSRTPIIGARMMEIKDNIYSVINPGDPSWWLSPREVLQKYGELMNDLYPTTWIDKAISMHLEIASSGNGDLWYSKHKGVINSNRAAKRDPFISCFSDIRHWSDVRALRNVGQAHVVLVRIKSLRVPSPPFNHKSETEQATIPDGEFDYVINNDGSIRGLYQAADTIVERVINGKTNEDRPLYLNCLKEHNE
jgi:hypothetical protein